MTTLSIPLPSFWGISFRKLYEAFRWLSENKSCHRTHKYDEHVGDESAFLNLLAKEKDIIAKICFSYSGTVAEYDDLMQDALINIWRGMKSFKGECAPRTWVYRVTINSCLSSIRKQARHNHADIEGLYGLVDPEENDREALELLYHVISELDSQDKPIIMMWLDEMNYDEIAAIMGLNRNTVATRLRRIKEKIIVKYKKRV